MKYKTLKTSVPRYLSQRINRRVNARTLCSSATPLLIQPFARTDFAKRSFQCAAPSVWNSLPVSVIGSDSLSVFKSRLKLSYFVSPITSTHNPLPPAPSKLRPYWRFTNMLIIIITIISCCEVCNEKCTHTVAEKHVHGDAVLTGDESYDQLIGLRHRRPTDCVTQQCMWDAFSRRARLLLQQKSQM